MSCVALSEKADFELCQAANAALATLEAEPDAPAERALPALEQGALTLERLSKRARFLSLGELAKKRVADGVGAPPPLPTTSAPSPRAKPTTSGRPGLGMHSSFELGDGPLSRLTNDSTRLERDAVRNLAAYLEYAELPVRRSAFAAFERLHEQHGQWPLLAQRLNEASLLEADPALKADLAALSASAAPSEPRSDHSADSK